MFHIVLHEPEIPPNTGNIIRLCANTGFFLHLVEPLGFSLEEKALRRAGLDYHEAANVKIHQSLENCLKALDANNHQVFAVTTKATEYYTNTQFKRRDILVFGAESKGLPQSFLDSDKVTSNLRIPMAKDSRSLNLSNAVAVVAFEAWRQHGFSKLT